MLHRLFCTGQAEFRKIVADEANNITAKTDIAETHFGQSYSSVVRDKSIDYTFNGNTAGYSYQIEGTDESEKMTADAVKYNGNTVLSSAYTYDDKDNITSKLYTFKIDGEDRTVDIQNQYDSEGRIIATGYGGYDIYYTYDSNGQLTKQLGDGDVIEQDNTIRIFYSRSRWRTPSAKLLKTL